MKTYAKHGAPDYNSKTAAGCEADGEPVFTLRAQDVYAAETVLHWASLVAPKNPTMAAEAIRISEQMNAWPDKKEPD